MVFMIRNIYFCLLLQLVCVCSATAQTLYSFLHKSEAYTELANSTPFGGVIPAIPVPFAFNMAGLANDTIFLLNVNFKMDYASSSPGFVAFGADMVNGTKSYEVTGTAGQRILKLQFKNMNFAHDFNVSDTIDYQVWFFEADNSIEVHFGRSYIQNAVWSYYYNEGGPYVGLYQSVGGGYYRLNLKGNASAPVADTAAGLRLQGTPVSGQVYRFAPQTTGIPAISEFLAVYPNPSDGRFYIRTRGKTGVNVSIRNSLGQLVYHKIGHSKDELLQTSLPAGIYLLEVDGKKEQLLVR
jgi:hypothetical protein